MDTRVAERLQPTSTISLVCMPWQLVDTPSIQLGMLQAALREQGVAAAVHSLHLAFADWAAARLGERAPWTPREHELVSTRWSSFGVPEWVFAVPPHRPEPDVAAGAFEQELLDAGMQRELLEALERLRRDIGGFVHRCADEVLARAPTIVGFSLVYSQTVPSLALARELKRRDPELVVLFGGASCDGPMGPAMLEAWPEVDLVLRGEGEVVLPRLVRALAAGDRATLRTLPGLCHRDDAGQVVANDTAPEQRADLATLTPPRYDEYFERLVASPLRGAVEPRLPYQSARGCWWGMKSHCTFCGLNGTDMTFRSKPPARVADELRTLMLTHGVLDVFVVDNILDMDYLRTLLPELARGPNDLALFFETKANLTEAQIDVLGEAGVRTIQPGIESLSTPILRLMGKGTSLLQNVRLLKWCAERDINVIWNLLYGFPGEQPDEYRRMAELVPSLVHLTPPSMTPLMMARFSPYFSDPARYGLELVAPLPMYEQFFGVDRELAGRLASVFDHRYRDGRDPATYVGALQCAVTGWREAHARTAGGLTFRRGPGFAVVTDTRSSRTPVRYELDGLEAAVHEACAAGASVAVAAARAAVELGRAVGVDEVARVLEGFEAARLVCRDGDRFLSLALRTSVAWGRRAVDRAATA